MGCSCFKSADKKKEEKIEGNKEEKKEGNKEEKKHKEDTPRLMDAKRRGSLTAFALKPDLLKEFSLIWLDIKADELKETEDHIELKTYFKNAYYEANTNRIKEILRQPESEFLVIATGEYFEDVKNELYVNKGVIAVCIYDVDPEKYKKYVDEHTKVAAVISNLEDLKKVMVKVYDKYQGRIRFYEDVEEKCFYVLSDKDSFVDALKVTVDNEKFSIFYPLGMKAVKIEEHLTPVNLSAIVQFAQDDKTLAKKYKDRYRDDNYMPFITNVTEFLKTHNNDMEEIILSFTKESLYLMLNYYLRRNSSRGFEVFKEYMFCLKGSMCQKGTPVHEPKTKLYRGLRLSEDNIKTFKEQENKLVLLNSFTSTTLDESIAKNFAMKGASDKKATLIYFTLVEFDEAFAKFILDFSFPEESGAFFPVDITEFSEFPNEKEVVFPPFYPIKIVQVTTDTWQGTTYNKIVVEAPVFVCISEQAWVLNAFKTNSQDKEYERIYLEEILDFTEKDVMDTICIVKKTELLEKEMYDRFLKVIRSATHIKKIILDNEALGDARVVPLIINCLSEKSKLQSLSLTSNKIGDEGAKEIGKALFSNETLITLVLVKNTIGSEGGIEIGNALKHNKTLKFLDLGENSLGGEGCSEIGFGLIENTSLIELNLLKNDVGDIGCAVLGMALTQNQTLQILNLDSNNIECTDSEFNKDKFGLHENKALQKLSLCSNKIGEEGGFLIGEQLKVNTALKELLLRDNEIGNRSAIEIGEALKFNKTLTLLQLNKNEIGDEGCQAIGAGLKNNESLLTLQMARNKIGDIGLKEILSSLETNKKILEIHLNNNDDIHTELYKDMDKRVTIQQ